MNDVPEHIGETYVPTVLTIGELEVIEAKQVKDGSVDIMDMNRITGGRRTGCERRGVSY